MVSALQIFIFLRAGSKRILQLASECEYMRNPYYFAVFDKSWYKIVLVKCRVSGGIPVIHSISLPSSNTSIY